MEKQVIKNLPPSVLKIGDTVLWKGSWGKEYPKEAKVVSIEVGDHCTNVTEIDWSQLVDRSVTVVLNNGHWAYGYQIHQLV